MKSFRSQWLFILGTVFLLGSCLPFWGTYASTKTCESVYRNSIGSPPPPLPQWTKIKSLEEKVQYIVSTWTKGDKNFYGIRDFVAKIRQLPPSDQQKWLQALGKSYQEVPKKDPDPTAPWHIGGRRLLDHALTLLENYPVRFESETQPGKTPQEAYREFLAYQSELFGTAYDSRAVEIVISTLQSELRKLELDGRPVPTVFIAGSFPNGKADLMKSDIDLSVSDASLAKFSQEWQRQVTEGLALAGIPSKMSLSFSNEGPGFYGKINPIVLQITSSQIQMLVFPAAILTQSQDQLASRPPTRYVF